MSTLRLRWTSDAAEFLERTGGFLRGRPVEHSILLSVPAQWVGVRSEAADANCWLWVEDGDQVLAAAILTPPHGVGVSPAPDEAVRLIAAELYDERPQLPSVSGVRPAAETFAATWRELGGPPASTAMAQGLYVADPVQQPDGVPGRLRLAQPVEAPLLRQWVDGFYREAGGVHDDQDIVGPRIEAGRLYLWDVDGDPVSMVAHTAAEGGVTRVQLVFTPQPLRGNGYASAVVAALTQQEQAHPGRVCMLYTDLANPTSNRIYQRIGYRRVGDAVTLAFG
ncbi:GNAT family N-acetyltransferase [Angustibacter sp. McL0619]|uniref:GNAT family N-acetyltransferase n=1 Tax=Angustibacter sp. McL0619 TaxID=3415676 RepID=UPI003CF62430